MRRTTESERELHRRITECLLGVALFVAASAKLYSFWRGGQWVISDLLYDKFAIALLLQGEYGLGIWLCIGGVSRSRFALAVCCFAIFTSVATYESLRGRTSCGCFGDLNIAPWVTASFDFGALCALWITRPVSGAPNAEKVSRERMIAAMVAMSMVSGILWTIFSSQRHGAAGSVVIVEPTKWKGKKLPLLNDILEGHALETGRWVVVLYHDDCSICRMTIPKYQALAMESVGKSGAPQVAFVRLPSTEDVAPLITASTAYLKLNLGRGHQWFATTPVLLAIEDGKVMFEAEGEDATHLPDRIPWAH